jgi:hypothetical protein
VPALPARNDFRAPLDARALEVRLNPREPALFDLR